MLIGVMGFGDLGRRLTAQLLLSDHDVLVYDPYVTIGNQVIFDKAVVPTADTNNLKTPSVSATASELLNRCTIVHWAVPSMQLSELPLIQSNRMVILHDSVMANSAKALEKREDRDRFAVAHCLMNPQGRVFIANEFENIQQSLDHFNSIGLSPERISVKQHDMLMAHTQGVFALMIALGMREELDKGFTLGNLTPSAIELREAVIKRESNWTKQTLQSILSNPELTPFVEEMLALLSTDDFARIILQ